MNHRRIIIFTKYSCRGPSSRYRIYQYKEFLDDQFNVNFFPLFDDYYFESLNSKSVIKIVRIFFSYVKRILLVFRFISTKNVVYIEYELLPYFPPILEYILFKTGVKFILDYDDAIFHIYDQHKMKFVKYLFTNKISTIAKYASVIITGSPYLTNYFKSFSNNIKEIPTSIDIRKYINQSPNKSSNDSFIIGWIGSKTTSVNVLLLKNVISYFSKTNSKVVFQFMGFDEQLKQELDFSNVEYLDWSDLNELNFLQNIDLGIMPLYDTSFNKGKCGFKLIQYMAVGKPTLSSPLEANIKINRNNKNLFAVSEFDWINSIQEFIENKEYYMKVGLRNREIVKEFYTTEGNSKNLVNILNLIEL